MANNLILAIDQGTTNTKALLQDPQGRAVFRALRSVELTQPHPGFVEQDPLALWQSVVDVANKCAGYAEANHTTIAGIAISNQRETAVAWRHGKTGKPIGNAMSWQCRRSAAICAQLSPHSELIQSISGLPLDPLLSATKWAWLFQQHPELHAAAQQGGICIGTVDAWLVYNLTAGALHATDHTNASRTALLNLSTLAWDDSLLALFNIPRAALPEVHPSSGKFGICTAIPALAGVPITAVIGDSHAALVGHGHYEPSTVKTTYGTGSSLMMSTRTLAPQAPNLARTVAWSTHDSAQFALEGNIAMSGAAVQWVGEFLGLRNPASDAAALAATVPDSAGLILVPAMVGLGAPHWDSAARGLICNLERTHTAAHFARAAVDAIAQQIADALEAMESTAGVRVSALLADGGATRNNTLMQFQADLLGRSVQRSEQEDLSARGAALLGGLALGWWKSIDELTTLPTETDTFEPHMAPAQRDVLRRAWKLAVQRARLREEPTA